MSDEAEEISWVMKQLVKVGSPCAVFVSYFLGHIRNNKEGKKIFNILNV